MVLVQHDDLREKLASAGSHPAFRDWVLPRTSRRSALAPDTEVRNGAFDSPAELRVAIEDQVPGRALEREGFPELLSHPAGVRVLGHREMNHVSACMPNGEPYVEELERGCWDNEEVHRRDPVGMIVEKGDPSFECRRRGWALRHVASNGPLGNVEAEA